LPRSCLEKGCGTGAIEWAGFTFSGKISMAGRGSFTNAERAAKRICKIQFILAKSKK
jgi:hypothetical protein